MRHFLYALLLAFVLPVATWAQQNTATSADEQLRHDGDQPKSTHLDKAPDGYYYTIQIIELQVHYNRTIDVVEHLRANFLEPSHGLFRTLPKRFWTKRDVSEAQDGSDEEMRYNAVEIDSLRVSEEFQPNDLDTLLDIRIGSADVWVNGLHDYKLSYRLTIPNDDRVDASDLFFHSIVGSGMSGATDTVYFKVVFDDEIPAASLDSLKVFCGPEGDERNRADELLFVKDSKTLKGRYYGLMPGEAITIFLPLPNGFFQAGKIPFWSTLAWIAAAITLLLVLYLLYNEIKGDQSVTKVVTFKPSKGITSADIGSLVDGSVDDIDLLSIIPWLAAEGYINMTQENGKTVITKNPRELPSDTPDYIRSLHEGFFLKSEKFYVDRPSSAFGVRWNKAKRQLETKYKSKLVDTSFIVELFLLTLFFSLTCCFASVPPEGYLAGAVVHFCLIMEYIFYSSWKSIIKRISFKNGCGAGCTSIGVIILLIFVIPMGLMMFLAGVTMNKDYYIPESILLGLGTATAGIVLFQYRLDRLSPTRRQYMGEILGLKEFILTAEKDRLEMLLKEDERYFYRILPYAMVFGLVDQWAAKFNGLTVVPVAEFNNVGTSDMRSLLFAKDMKAFASKSSYAAIPTSHSSSSGGSWRSPSSSGGSYRSSSSHSSGGYSGGGSGGGGSRSW